MAIGRRQFLKAMAAVWGTVWLQTVQRVEAAELQYVSSLDGSARKLALLVGINHYEASGDWLPLHGCLTDVELQRELLIHRFGFAPPDILVLTDQLATKNNLEMAIKQHLVSQASGGDVIVFHFSGHGSLLNGGSGAVRSLVAIDGDIPEPVLLAWLGEAATDKILCVLDAGAVYPGAPVVGNFRIRAKPASPLTTPVPALDPNAKRPTVLRAVTGDQLCADAHWTGFSSGVFTYALTQQLWQSTASTSMQTILAHARSQVSPKAVDRERLDLPLPLQPVRDVSADAVIRDTSADRRMGETWLGGLPIMPLSYYGVGSLLAVADQGEVVQVKSHNGLTAKVEVVGSGQRLQTGQLLQEQVRAVPKQLQLAIALDVGLNRIERVDATSAISTLGGMVGVNAGEGSADCLFGNQNASYGLFSVTREPLLGSFGSVGESVGSALRRLQPLLQSLLAAKILRLTSNQESSCVAVRVSLTAQMGTDNQPQILATRCTARSSLVQAHPDGLAEANKSLAIGDRLSLQVANLMNVPLYVTVFCFDARGRMLVPSFVSSPYASDGIVLPQQTLMIPQPKTPFNWTASAPQGLVHLQVVVSRQPFPKTATILAKSLQQSPSSTGLITAVTPLPIVEAVLSDLSSQDQADNWLLDVNNWATLDFSYRVA
ncbi:MAG: caspase family protein [Pseudanabaenaceae cyanobacterium]